MVDLRSRRTLTITGLVIAGMLLTSFGFNAISPNPAVPDADLSIGDAPAPGDLTQPGTVPLVHVEHAGGEAIPTADLRVVIGSRAEGLTFDREGNWTASAVGLTYEVTQNGHPIRAGTTFGAGDVLEVSKTVGTLDSSDSFEFRVRVDHRPSQSTIANTVVTIE